MYDKKVTLSAMYDKKVTLKQIYLVDFSSLIK